MHKISVQKSKLTIYIALAANTLIAATKFIAGTVSNSSAMISEGFHSLVDTLNELLLLWGIKQSNKPKDVKHPFGYGRELFFWSFMVSMLIFFLGGSISVYLGVLHLLHPEPLGDPFWNYIVLCASVIFEGASFIVAAKQFNKTRRGQSWWHAFKNSKDPPTFLILFEDGAALIGLTIALLCIALGHYYNNPHLDGVASLLVGLLLIGVSLVLAHESRSLLMGESISNIARQRIIAITQNDDSAENLISIFSIYVGPEEILLIMNVQFKSSLRTPEIYTAIERIQQAIQQEYPNIKYLIIQPKYLESNIKRTAL